MEEIKTLNQAATEIERITGMSTISQSYSQQQILRDKARLCIKCFVEHDEDGEPVFYFAVGSKFGIFEFSGQSISLISEAEVINQFRKAEDVYFLLRDKEWLHDGK